MDPSAFRMDDTLGAVLRGAGEAVMNIYRAGFSVERKADASPVTAADLLANEIITAYLKRRYPFPILSEEGKDTPYEVRSSWETFWLLDPLDGTKEFIGKTGEFTINIALVHRRRPVLGIVYLPATDVLYYASRGTGAYKMERGITARLPLAVEKKQFIVVGSRSHRSPEFARYVERLQALHDDTRVISAGSALKFCLIAEGIADIYPRLGPTMEWDTAAGQVIVEEAGGHVVNAETGLPLMYNKTRLVNPFFTAVRSGSVWT